MSVESLLNEIKKSPEVLVFATVIQSIDENYTYEAREFKNGIGDDPLINEAGTNQGSCKVFAFAQINHLNEQETLVCFGEHYRDVVADPDGESHANIRRFMRDGWAGINFDQCPLVLKT